MGEGIQLLSHQIGISNIDREAEKPTLLPAPALFFFVVYDNVTVVGFVF